MMPPLWEKVISTLLNTDLRYVRVNSTDLLDKKKSLKIFFLGGAPTSNGSFFCWLVRSSVRPFIRPFVRWLVPTFKTVRMSTF